MKRAKPTIAVVGAGIVGACIAYHLARRGATVILVERDRPAAGVTGRTFAWINVSHGSPGPSLALRQLAIGDYRRLERELGDALPIRWCGALTWHHDLNDTRRFVREHDRRGYDIRLLERSEIAALEPNLLEPPGCAAYAPNEGALDAAAATEALVEAARFAGADIRIATSVTALAASSEGITGLYTNQGEIEADIVVLASGTEASSLCKPLGVNVPIDPSPAIVLQFKTPSRLVNTVMSSPSMEIRQASDSQLIAAEDYIDDSPQSRPEAIARQTLVAIRKGLRGGKDVALESIAVGVRPIPADGIPIVGFSPEISGLYVAVMHAGVTLAPTIGRLVATELLDGTDAGELSACRIDRFATGQSRATS